MLRVKKTLGDRVLIRRREPPKKYGMIEIPDEVRGKERIATAYGVVEEVGPLAFKSIEMRDVQATMPDGTVVTAREGAPWCKAGDLVLYSRYTGQRIPDPQAQEGYMPELVFVLDRDLICVLEEVEDEDSQNG